jgi:hypothetical protein
MRWVTILTVTAWTVACGAALAQDKGSTSGGCEPGFVKRSYPHGSEHNFRCRSRVVDCPDRRGHHATVVLEETLDLAAGVQFGYRCEYRSQDR